MPGVIKHDQRLSLAMIPVSLYSLYIVIDDILEAFKTDVFKVLYVHVFSPELSETSLDIFTVLDHVFNVLKAFKAWPLSKLIVILVLYYAPIITVWLKGSLRGFNSFNLWLRWRFYHWLDGLFL